MIITDRQISLGRTLLELNHFLNKNLLIFQQSTAFTFAEVLITLSIIGVVAAMTIPPLVQSYQKSQYVAGLKKEYSIVQQAYRAYIADEGVPDLSQTDLYTLNENDNFEDSTIMQNLLDGFIKKYFKIIKSCNVDDNSCNYQTFNLTSPADAGGFANGTYAVFLADGAALSIWPYSPRCESGWESYCGMVTIDVNGAKLPNKFGRDIFEFDLNSVGNLSPYGGAKDCEIDGYSGFGDLKSDYFYWKNTSQMCGDPNTKDLDNDVVGDGCAARIMEQDWQMNY